MAIAGRLEQEELFQTFCDACPFDVSREKFSQIFAKLDANGDGVVTIDEFIDFLLKSQLGSSTKTV